ncbi:MAG: heme biosynthesis protein HemY, partial [Acetobacteraceae bacterium]|nr:heme biosynthesis protein HemY [Acetobacteraceae bacterium]
MRRALLILVVLAAGVALALWLAQVGGSVEVRVGEYGIDTPMPIALL